MALFKKKIPREILVHMLAEQAVNDTEGALQAFGQYIGGDEVGTPLTADSQFTKELLALNFSIRGGGFVQGVFPKAPDHMQNGLIEMVQRLGSVGGTSQSFPPISYHGRDIVSAIPPVRWSARSPTCFLIARMNT